MDRRTPVFKALEAKLAQIDEIRTIKVGTIEPRRECDRPVVGLLFEKDVQERISKEPIKDQGMVFRIRVVSDEDIETANYELLALMSLIEEKIEEDRKLGSLVRDLIPGEWQSLYFDAYWRQAGADLVCTAWYARV